MKTLPTPAELETLVSGGKLKRWTYASRRGYTSRRNRGGYVEPYKGRYGVGFIHVTPRFDTTRFVGLCYYVQPK